MPGAIKIGVAVSEVSEFVAIEPAYGIGDQEAQVRAAFERAARDGRLPVHGRDVELTFRTFGSTGTESKRAVADQFAADDVLAVIGARDFTYGAVRLAEAHGIPVIDVNAIPRALHSRTAPWLFTLRAAQDLVYVTFVRWAHRSGLLAGRRIGVFSDRFTRTSTAVALTELEVLGCPATAHVDSDGAGVGSDDDEAVARGFQAQGIDTIIPFVSGSSLARMLAIADSLDYCPTIVDLETGEHPTDIAGSMMPARIYDGTMALVMNCVGDAAGGRAFADRAEQAVGDVEAHGGRPLARCGRANSGEVSNILITRDLCDLMIAGLTHAGPELSRESLVAGLEQIREQPTVSGGRVTFRAGEHWGFREMRAVRWSASSGTWNVMSEYEPICEPAIDRQEDP